jgi:hypothetical protein
MGSKKLTHIKSMYKLIKPFPSFNDPKGNPLTKSQPQHHHSIIGSSSSGGGGGAAGPECPSHNRQHHRYP